MISTPWEEYEINQIPVYVKREDLCSNSPAAPRFSKIRGLDAYLRKQDRHTIVGVMDTVHSMAGWGAAYVCYKLHMSCVDFYPVLKADTGLRPNQIRAQALGALLYPMKAGMSAVLYNQAKKILKTEHGVNSLMLPNGLKIQETVDATAEEVLLSPNNLIKTGTWVVSISSGTIACGVIKGLDKLRYQGKIVLHMGYSRSEDEVKRYIKSKAECYPFDMDIIDEGYEYKDKVDNSWIPFLCNEFYDAKAFTWLSRNIDTLPQPVIFWNIGA
jgi:hypothetical protein